MIVSPVQTAVKHWRYVAPYVQRPQDGAAYQELVTVADGLFKLSLKNKDASAASLLHLIATQIEAYEKQCFPQQQATPVEVLQFLMTEHSLKQQDLPEIGDQSLVSKILHGKRKLTVEHIRKLASRFGVSAAVFIPIP